MKRVAASSQTGHGNLADLKDDLYIAGYILKDAYFYGKRTMRTLSVSIVPNPQSMYTWKDYAPEISYYNRDGQFRVEVSGLGFLSSEDYNNYIGACKCAYDAIKSLNNFDWVNCFDIEVESN